MDYSEKIDNAIGVGLRANKLEDSTKNRLFILQKTYESLTRDLPTTPDQLGLLQTIEGMMMDLKRSSR
jgi:hypothetical protein